MRKKIVLLLALCLAVPWAAWGGFSDVTEDHPYYPAIQQLSDLGVVSGYADGTFRPDGAITRAEAAAILVRAAGLSPASTQSAYADVPSDFWACSFIMAATNAGILQGVGNGLFAPDDHVTYHEIIKMVVCMVGLEEKAQDLGGWSAGYTAAAEQCGILPPSVSAILPTQGDAPATRGDAAQMLYLAMPLQTKYSITLGGETFTLGMDADALGVPDEILASTGPFQWYVYGTDTYENFYAAGVAENQVVALASAGLGFDYNGYGWGDTKGEDAFSPYLYTDSNDGGKIHGVLLLLSPISHPGTSPAELAGESKMNFHFTNAFRVCHGLSPLEWSEEAATVARLHSQDMAQNDYFSHTDQSGRDPGQRLTEQGLGYFRYGENISAGASRYLGFHSYDGWVNSQGHRENLLSENTSLGVGIAYHQDSTYGYYHTQLFYTPR